MDEGRPLGGYRMWCIHRKGGIRGGERQLDSMDIWERESKGFSGVMQGKKGV